VGLRNLFKSFIDGGKLDVHKRYEFMKAAVSGTMSDFYMARDRETGKIVGLKLLDRDKTDQLESRFRGLDKPGEGEISSQFDHPRIVKTYEYGTTSTGQQYIVMEYLDGPGLNSLIVGRSKLLDGNRVTLLKQAAEALAVVHNAGYIHRDVCPRNFVCAKDATSLKLIDFGVTVPAKKEFMQPGIRTGTPNYMAPEVVRRKPTDKRIDIFSFGVSMYEMFAFELPWARGSDGLAAMSHGQTDPKPLGEWCPHIHPDLEGAIMKCLASSADERFPNIEGFLNAIRRVDRETVALGASP
jgi:serine/threonine-protein kinase